MGVEIIRTGLCLMQCVIPVYTKDPIPEQVNLNTKARGNSYNDVKAIRIYFYCFEFSLNLIDAVAFDKPKIYFRQTDHFSIPSCSG